MRATGFACDVCKTFATSKDDRSVPQGWMTVNVSVTRAIADNAAVNTMFHICSNKCLRDLGTARWRAERDEVGVAVESNGSLASHSNTITSSGREISPEGRQAMRQNGLRIQHNKGNHAEANADCELCQTELGMTAEELRDLLRQGQ